MEYFTETFESLGLSVALLLLFIFGTVKVIRWLAPRIEQVFKAHIELVNDLQTQVTQQTELTRETLTAVQDTNLLLKNDGSR